MIKNLEPLNLKIKTESLDNEEVELKLDDILWDYFLWNLLPYGIDDEDALEILKELPVYYSILKEIKSGNEDIDIAIYNLLHCAPIYNPKTRRCDEYEIDLRIDFISYERIITKIQLELEDVGLNYSRLSIYEFVNNLARKTKITCSNLTLCYTPHPKLEDDFVEYCAGKIYNKYIFFFESLKQYCKDDENLFNKLSLHYEWLTSDYFGYHDMINFKPNALKERNDLLCELGFYGYHGYRKIVKYNYSWCGLNKQNTYKLIPYYFKLETYKPSRKPTPNTCDYYRLFKEPYPINKEE